MDFSPKMFREIPSTIAYHYREGNINWAMTIYLSFVHVVALAGILAIPRCSKETLLFAFSLWPISGMGITVGAHRLWAHRSFEACFIVRLYLMLMNSVCNQGSIFHWSRDHRVHHKYTETDADPHNATRGFFFAHVGWLILKKHPAVIKAGREMDFSDLLDDPIVRFQDAVDPWFALYMCYVMPAQVAYYFWNENFWNAFLVAGGLRYAVVFNVTFLVNSAAHLYGDHPYDVQSYPAENPIVSCLAGGEGWHNWHHKYPYDYATSEFGIATQYNPSKLLIDIFAALGLVWGRKRATAAWSMGRKRRDRDAANGVPLPKREPRPWEVDAAAGQGR